jgi:Zn finger protein HypA/HybF involved in hydrogenase expression
MNKICKKCGKEIPQTSQNNLCENCQNKRFEIIRNIGVGALSFLALVAVAALKSRRDDDED